MPTPPFPYEEILLPSLYAHFTGINPGEICKVFWNMPNYTPTYEQIINERCPCVKRVDRAFNDPIRVQLRERANNYTDIESK